MTLIRLHPSVDRLLINVFLVLLALPPLGTMLGIQRATEDEQNRKLAAFPHLGLTRADVDGNFSHNVFGGSFGMNVIDSVEVDGVRVPLSLATRRRVTPDGVPEPPAAMLIGVGLALGAARIRQIASRWGRVRD